MRRLKNDHFSIRDGGRVLALSLIFLSFSFSQEIPNEFFTFQVQKLLADSGEEWQSVSTFGPYRRNISTFAQGDSLKIDTRFGIWSTQSATALYGYGHFSFNSHFYGFLYPRIVNDPSAFQRYSGIPRDIERGGFSSGETDMSGIGFENEWLLFQLGRGRQSWGAGENIQLALGEQSPSYDHALVQLDFGHLRARYFHGFLESVDVSINRYITGRGIEWTNQHSFIVGISETAIYSGANRPIDIGYFNPISTHLEIELNDRLNQTGTGSANAVWQCSVDWLALPRLRLSGNLLYDEFVLDKIEFDQGKENGMAYSAKIAFTPIYHPTHFVTLVGSTVFVGTPTFRHGNGYNNFVQRDKPLGWIYGSDGQSTQMGVQYYHEKYGVGLFEIGKRKTGDESIVERPYDAYADYLAGPFPSGTPEEISFITLDIQGWWKKQLSFFVNYRFEASNLKPTQHSFLFGVDVFYPMSFIVK